MNPRPFLIGNAKLHSTLRMAEEQDDNASHAKTYSEKTFEE
jgi:hypothetical protein